MEHQKLPYEIDFKNNSIRYSPDEDLPAEEYQVTELLDLLAWWRSRQGVVRKMAYERDPLPVASPMRLVGDYYIGVCSDMARVKVAKADWDKVMSETERIVRSNWLFDIKERRKGIRGATLQILDDQGRPTQMRDQHGNVIPPEPEWTEADCPDTLIQAEIIKRRTAEWWNVRDENLARGTWVKLP